MKTEYIEILSIFLIVIGSIATFYILKLLFGNSNGSTKVNDIPPIKPFPIRNLPTAEQCATITSENYLLDSSWTGAQMVPGDDNKDWVFFTGTDPTRGNVQYDKWYYLLKTYGNSLRINVDPNPIGAGRRSIRLISTKIFNTDNDTADHLFIIDAEHIPEGLSVWPAFWLVGIPSEKVNNLQISNWACYGEIDIIEGCNSVASDPSSNKNLSSLHTNRVEDKDGNPTEPCIQGILGINNPRCDASSSDLYTCGCNGNERCPNIGCGMNNGLFGNAFNNAGGGIYACLLTKDGGVTIWSFQRKNIPDDILCEKPTPSKWTTDTNKPIVFKECPYHFKNLMLVVNTTICGEWAGNSFKDGDRKGMNACRAFSVDRKNNYADAYWYINYIKVFSKP